MVGGVDVDLVAAAVRGCPAVAGLVAGPPGGVTTYLPGRRVNGITVTADTVLIQVRGRWEPVTELAAQVRLAASELAPLHRVDVIVADIEEPPPARVSPCGNSLERRTS
ncbi:hypothetical protein ADL15_05110 [Actinoplanes awajinensis subsp. mycoplanecinus]|uniref:Asp23/Gls24 family envelope stress response protein n=1 Tax=Actinoplanes awajinensis subsp. mycoplanecinus TaxID=135947 RepID=A0A0X3VA15_9ACTN|nr:hypothetical protein ADL15_05110 [Actinoplanes awajinensis subsp. mycoplanecinus]